jgi:preprotein translocase subunit SecG
MGVQVPPSAPKSPPILIGVFARKSDRMIYLVIIIHVVVCLFLIGVILLQQGKSADLAGAFGGQGSQTAFGPRSAANLLTRLTTWCAVIFMLTSIGLTILMQKQAARQHSVLSGTSTTQSTPANKK